MNFFENFLLAFQNIRKGKMRAFLTMLGIIIGIASVMVIIGIGNGLQDYMTSMFEGLGTKSLTVTLTGQGSTAEVSVEDMYEIVEDNPDYFDKITPTVTMRGTVKIGTESLSSTKVTGIGEAYFDINELSLANGRPLRYVDMHNRAKVCVVGSYIDRVWFGGNSLGESLRIGQNVFTIVGVLEQEDDEIEEGGSDDTVYIPHTTAARLSGSKEASSFTVTVASEDKVDEATELLEDKLYEKYRSEDAYMVSDMSVIVDTMNEMIGMVITVLAVIAGISLVVGGIGIMNIMLVSVSERTREIGIRKALGAKERYIMSQFIIEAAVISAIGGLIGIGMGYAMSSVASTVISSLMEDTLNVTPSAMSIAVAFGSSAIIGILFGFLPARKAARLNPIDALRHD